MVGAEYVAPSGSHRTWRGQRSRAPTRATTSICCRALRRRCGLEPGDRVLLAAALEDDTLTAYPLAVVDQAIRAYGAAPRAQGEKP